ncbi:unnamed protein product [Lampetra planeri]
MLLLLLLLLERYYGEPLSGRGHAGLQEEAPDSRCPPPSPSRLPRYWLGAWLGAAGGCGKGRGAALPRGGLLTSRDLSCQRAPSTFHVTRSLVTGATLVVVVVTPVFVFRGVPVIQPSGASNSGTRVQSLVLIDINLSGN